MGGTRFEYGGKFTFSLKEVIRDRDNRLCQECGLDEKSHQNKYNQKLPVHHIDYNKLNNTVKNLITLCVCCHNKISNTNKAIKQEIFTKRVNEFYNIGDDSFNRLTT